MSFETLGPLYDTTTGQHHIAGDPTEIAGLKPEQQGPVRVDEGATFTAHVDYGFIA